jgi:formylglycine-generating enzyme required for sulfatase activity
MPVRLKLAAKAGLFAASLVAAIAHAPPASDQAGPETVVIGAATIAYRLAGDFQQEGRTVDAPNEERAIPDLRIMKYQLTGAQYDACVAERACPPRARSQSSDARLPAVLLSYEDASAYASWISAKTGENWRLPTDEEWRAAAGTRARDDALGLAGNVDPSERWLARYDAESAEAKDDERLRPIGGFGVNEHGLYDLSGNVWEWTASCFVRYGMGPGGAKPVTTNCGVRVVEGAHRTYITDFIRDARAGGCAVGKPPAHLGVRLVKEGATLSAFVARVRGFARGGVAWL